ncbi:MAG: amidohydrolase family protein [Bacteroidales bacterium]|nr:amidohydrolase family protein [Bacteroidales bacterium]
MTILLKNANYVDSETFDIKKCHLIVTQESANPVQFLNINEQVEAQLFNDVIDCNGKYVMQSFVCGHHHAYSALARGMGGPMKPPANFYENLKYLWWALDKSLNKESIEASALATAISCAKNGVSFIIDHHASPFHVQGSLDIIAKAFEKVGLSHLLCYEISDRDGSKIAAQGLEETDTYLKDNQGLVGLHASFTVENDTLDKAVKLAAKHHSGIHIHTAEDLCDQELCLEKYNMRVVERLQKAGVLSFPKTILVHCLHLSENERRLIAESPVYIAQNIESNSNNNVGYFRGAGLNNNIMLGTDGMHSDMLRSFKAAYIFGQSTEGISMPEAYQRFFGPHQYIKKNGFNGNGDNNLIILDYDAPTPVNTNNFLGHLIFGIDSKHISHVISNGKLIVKDKKLTLIDEEAVLKYTTEIANSLWKVFSKQKV